MDHDHHAHHMHHHVENASALPAITTAAPEIHMNHDHSAHDHSAHGSEAATGNAMNHAMHHMMEMAFHGGYEETILFDAWKIDSIGGLIWSMIVIFIFGVLYEGLKYYRENLFWKSHNALQYRAVSAPEKNGAPETDDARVVQPTIFSTMHFYQSFLHLVQVTLSLMLMLIFMTYNTWLCLSVVFGAMVGYFLFGWKKSVVVDVTEHCH